VPAQWLSKICVNLTMKKISILLLFISALPFMASAQHSDESGNIRQLTQYQDSLTWLGKKLVNDDTEMERMNANKEEGW